MQISQQSIECRCLAMNESPLSSHDVSLELLELFLAVVKFGTISLAARHLDITPSVASRKISSLEASMQTRLLERTTRRTHLTEAGALVVEWARGVMAGHESLTNELSAIKGQPSGLLRIVMNEYVGTVLLPTFLADFAKKYPQIRYSLTLTDSVVDPDERGYDVAARVPDSELIGKEVMPVNRILCASPDYLQREGIPKSLEDLKTHDCLTHKFTVGSIWYFRTSTGIVKYDTNAFISSDNYLALMELARKGLGIVLVSDAAVREDLARGSLVQVLPEFQSVFSDGARPGIWILYPTKNPPLKTQWFVSEISEYLKKVLEISINANRHPDYHQ